MSEPNAAPLSESEIQEIEARASAFPPGELDYDETMTAFYNDAEGNSCGGNGTGFYEVFRHLPAVEGDEEATDDVAVVVECTTKAEAEFFTNAQTDIPRLIATIRAKEAEIERLREQRRELCIKLLEQNPAAAIVFGDGPAGAPER